MNFPELLSLSRPAVSENGRIVYRFVAPVTQDTAHQAMFDAEKLAIVGSVWTEPLPNSQKVALMWLPATKKEAEKLFDAFISRELTKAMTLAREGTFKVSKPGVGILQVENTKTKTVCRMATNPATRVYADMCIQGQRCGICKHYCLAVIRKDIEDETLYEHFLSMDARGEI